MDRLTILRMIMFAFCFLFSIYSLVVGVLCLIGRKPSWVLRDKLKQESLIGGDIKKVTRRFAIGSILEGLIFGLLHGFIIIYTFAKYNHWALADKLGKYLEVPLPPYLFLPILFLFIGYFLFAIYGHQ